MWDDSSNHHFCGSGLAWNARWSLMVVKSAKLTSSPRGRPNGSQRNTKGTFPSRQKKRPMLLGHMSSHVSSAQFLCFDFSIGISKGPGLAWMRSKHDRQNPSSQDSQQVVLAQAEAKLHPPKPNQAGTRGDQRFLAETGLSDLGWSWMLVLHALLNPRSRGHYLQAVLKTTLFLLGHTKSFRLQVSLGWIANRFLQIVANCIEIVFSLENTFAILFAQAISWIRFFAGKVWW